MNPNAIFSNGILTSVVMGLWTIWFVVLFFERKWFLNLWRCWGDMSPSMKAFMAVLLTYSTIVAQKPSNLNNSATLPETTEVTGGTSVQQQLTQPSVAVTLDDPQAEPMLIQTEPVRIVFQATFATDTRVTEAFSGEPGWDSPLAVPVTSKLSALSFAGSETNAASPVCFSNTESVAVQTLMFVTYGAATDLATLMDGPETLRLRLVPDGGQQVETSEAERSLTAQFVPQQWQIISADFEAPANLSGMFFGGTAGRPVWDRRWRGEMAEAVGFNGIPDEDLKAGVANYLAIRWGLGSHPATPEQRAAAIAAGLRYGLVWGSVLIVK